MNSNIALIQLVSEQTMQNVVPAIALKPVRLIHLLPPKVAARSGQISEAARQAHPSVKADLENIQLSEMPSLVETRDAVSRAISNVAAEGLLPVVNFTGGTKLMSIGAHEAAAAAQATSVYVDTEFRHFTDGMTGKPLTELLGTDLSFTPFQRVFTVNAIAVANGCTRVTGGKPFATYKILSEHFLRNPADEQASWEAMYGHKGICPNGREPRSPRDWLNLCDKPLSLPSTVANLGSSVGLLAQSEGSTTLACPRHVQLESMANNPRFRVGPEFFQAIAPLQFAVAFLGGGWWEIAVADSVEKSGRFRDIRWSISAGERGFGGSMEEDVVAVDGVQIAYFSCKRGGAGAKLTRQLEEMDASAKRLGGAFARKFFCIYLSVSPSVQRSLSHRANELHICLLGSQDIPNPDVFSPKIR